MNRLDQQTREGIFNHSTSACGSGHFICSGKRQALAGSGMAWLPAFSIAEELADGRLVRMGGPSWTARLTISLFCSPDRLDPVGQALWQAF